jgi:hypothetical protein
MILIRELRKNQSAIDYKISTTDFDQKIIIPMADHVTANREPRCCRDALAATTGGQ